ncbi:MAG: sensor domain-containing protein [Acidimicrobiales bacterium]
MTIGLWVAGGGNPAVNTDGSSPLRILLDLDTRIAAIDAQLAVDLGYDAQRLLDTPFSRLVAASDIAATGTDLVALVSGDQDITSGKRQLVTASGDLVQAAVSAESRVGDTGLVGFSLAVTLDDQESPSGPALPDHLHRLEIPAAVINAHGKIADTNTAWADLFGLEGPNSAAIDVFTLVHSDDRGEFHQRIDELARGAVTAVRTEHRCITAQGPFWCRLSLAAYDTGIFTHFTVTAEDISTEHLTNRVLLANEALFRSLAESSPIGLARLAPDLSIAYANPIWEALTRDESADAQLDIASILHPSGRKATLAELSERIDTSSNDPVVTRLARASDRPTWVSLRIGSVADDELGLIGHVITIEDVSDAVSQTESQGQLAGIVESTSDLVGIADLRTGRILYLNAAAEDHLGIQDTTATLVNELYTEDALAMYRREVYPVLRRGETWTGDLDMVRADGSTIRVRQTVAAQIGADGEPDKASVLGRDVSDERQALDELAYKATHDALTGLPNRSLLIDHLELALARSARDHRPVAVLFIDLDRFKTVNDTYGHEAGDTLLRELADRMANVLRPSDTVARLGGDEFVVLAEDIDGELDALTIADRVRSAIEDMPVHVGDVELQVSASIGIAISNGGSSREPDNLLQRADTAMYRAKHAGRARTELFDDVLRDRAKRRTERTEQLAQAIEEGSLEVHYQPIVDLHTGRVDGVEALVRWPHQSSGLLGPSEFLPLAVETGLVQDLDALVLRRACQDGRRWFAELGDKSPTVHVNVDGITLLSGALAETIEQCLNSVHLPGDKLCIELSEQFLMANGDTIVDEINSYNKRGLRIAVDDVGTGATKLPRLGRFRLDTLKVDGSLTGKVAESPEARQLVSGIVALGEAFDLRVGGECIEDAKAIPVLRELGVAVAQGHVFSAALPAAKIEPLLTLRSTLARADR